jgi:nucleoside-diphosphate-sugar epimerase
MEIENKKALVTGGCGFVGSNLVDRLVELGYDVTVLDNMSSISSSLDYVNRRAVYFTGNMFGDILDIDKNLGDTQFDVIFHLAAEARIQPSFEDPERWFTVNALGTMKVLEFARKSGCKSFVYATTSSKNHGSHLITPYTFAKVVGEDAVKMYAELYGMNTAMATFYNVYGPREPKIGEFATVTAKFLRQHWEDNQPVSVVGDGSQSRDFTHVEDIVEGLVEISYGNWKGHNFDLGRGNPVSILDLASMVIENKENQIIFAPERKGEGKYTMSEWRKTHSMLGWRATHDIKDWISNKIKEYKNV